MGKYNLAAFDESTEVFDESAWKSQSIYTAQSGSQSNSEFDPIHGEVADEQNKNIVNMDGVDFKMDLDDSLECQTDIKNSAIALLANREHSQKELHTKLARKFSNPSAIDRVIKELCDIGYQSDERFVESFIRAKKSAGKGPVAIKHELKEKGISEYLIAAYIYDNDDEWRELAERVYLKKFGEEPVGDFKEKGKRLRFMASRGFPGEIAYDLIEDSFSQ